MWLAVLWGWLVLFWCEVLILQLQTTCWTKSTTALSYGANGRNMLRYAEL